MSNDQLISQEIAAIEVSEKLATGVIHIHIREHGRSASAQRSQEAALEEAIGLALSINLDIKHSQAIQLNRISPSTLMGSGNVESLAAMIRSFDIKLMIIDGILSSIQQRNLERAWKCKVIDRTGLILEIFGERAQTAEGSLQVELAALKHQRSRLVRSWTHLERQRGGFGFTGGPGERQLELDRRMIDNRIIKIEKELESTKRMRGLHRKARERNQMPVVALVGYTNAGKSTLFNRLTHADVFVKDLLFATLDPTMRVCKLPGGREVIFSDTVGFISNLPTQLIAAFRATLEEVCTADVILHIHDCAHPDKEVQTQDVLTVLKELGIEEGQKDAPLMIQVFNKVDLLDEDDRDILFNQLNRQPHSMAISAETGEGVPPLLSLIHQRLMEQGQIVEIELPSHEGEILAWCYRKGVILSRSDKEQTIYLTLRLDKGELKKFIEYKKGRVASPSTLIL